MACIRLVVCVSCTPSFLSWWFCHYSGPPGTLSMLPSGKPNCKVGTFECKANESIMWVLHFRQAVHGFDLVHCQILQISTWATRMLSSILLCIRWFQPQLTTLQLDGPRATANRVYLLTISSLEIIVSDLMYHTVFY